VVLFLSLIFCKQEEKLLFFGSVSGCTCLILYGKFKKKKIKRVNDTYMYDIIVLMV
jgi:hypothetical protein